MRDLARLVAGLAQPELPVTFEPTALPQHLVGSPSFVCPDITKARRVLGYSPQVGLREGLMKTLRWYQEFSPEPVAP